MIILAISKKQQNVETFSFNTSSSDGFIFVQHSGGILCSLNIARQFDTFALIRK